MRLNTNVTRLARKTKLCKSSSRLWSFRMKHSPEGKLSWPRSSKELRKIFLSWSRRANSKSLNSLRRSLKWKRPNAGCLIRERKKSVNSKSKRDLTRLALPLLVRPSAREKATSRCWDVNFLRSMREKPSGWKNLKRRQTFSRTSWSSIEHHEIMIKKRTVNKYKQRMYAYRNLVLKVWYYFDSLT